MIFTYKKFILGTVKLMQQADTKLTIEKEC
jgi:hypothetical protein